MKKLILLSGIIFLLSGITSAQVKSSMAVKDLNSGIEKYIKKNKEGYKATEAFRYAVCYEIIVVKAGVSESLVFDAKGKFLTKKTETIIPVRTRTTIAIKDLNSDVEKYVKKNLEGSVITEAYLYDEAFSVKIIKGENSESLLFDKDGKFEKKITEPAAVKEQPKKADSVPAKKETKEEKPKADSTLKK